MAKECGDIRRKSGKMPDFSELVKFVEASAKEANDPVYGQLYNKAKNKAKQHSKLGYGQDAARSTSFSTDVATSKKDTKVKNASYIKKVTLFLNAKPF